MGLALRYSVKCPRCSRPGTVPDGVDGKVCTCPGCRQRFRVCFPDRPVVYPISASCPSCGQVLDPAPKRSKPCPACRKVFYVRHGFPVTRENAIKWDDERGVLGTLLTTAERRHRIKGRMKEWQEKTARQLDSLKTMLDFFTHVYITACHDDRCCEFCRSQDNKEIPIKDCSPAMLPPFPECENKDDGCRCGFIALTPRMYAKRHGLQRPALQSGQRTFRIVLAAPLPPSASL